MKLYETGESIVDIYDIWENGDSLGDSVTPSRYNSNYRPFIVFLMLNQLRLRIKPNIISLGSSNAFVEKELLFVHEKITD